MSRNYGHGFSLNEDREPVRAISKNQAGPSSRNFHPSISAPESNLPFPTRTTAGPSKNIIANRRAINIAPLIQVEFTPQSTQDEAEARKELRKIRKRKAAARSYQRGSSQHGP